MLIGEQPGNDEDRAGAPFVGPAGRELDRGLARAGIDRRTVYVTNAVKHFKWEPRGKKRIHQKPTAREIAACRLWLDAEIEAVQPTAIVCLGATAAQTLLGRSFRVTQARGERIASPVAPVVMATVHPSAILRARTDEDREREREAFAADLSRLSATSSAPKPEFCRNAPGAAAEIRAPFASWPQPGMRLAADGSGAKHEIPFLDREGPSPNRLLLAVPRARGRADRDPRGAALHRQGLRQRSPPCDERLRRLGRRHRRRAVARCLSHRRHRDRMRSRYSRTSNS